MVFSPRPILSTLQKTFFKVIYISIFGHGRCILKIFESLSEHSLPVTEAPFKDEPILLPRDYSMTVLLDKLSSCYIFLKRVKQIHMNGEHAHHCVYCPIT